jgi:hypothetical protein
MGSDFVIAALSTVITRLDRVIQYSRDIVLNREAAAYWIARSSRAMTAELNG